MEVETGGTLKVVNFVESVRLRCNEKFCLQRLRWRVIEEETQFYLLDSIVSCVFTYVYLTNTHLHTHNYTIHILDLKKYHGKMNLKELNSWPQSGRLCQFLFWVCLLLMNKRTIMPEK